MTISGKTFWQTVVAGLIATFVMTVTGFWQSGLGLPAWNAPRTLIQVEC